MSVADGARRWHHRHHPTNPPRDTSQPATPDPTLQATAARAQAHAAGVPEAIVTTALENLTDRLTAAQQTQLLAGLDPTAYMTDDGQADTAKLQRLVSAVAPAPSHGQGRRPGAPTGNPLTIGANRWADRHRTRP